VGKTVRISDEHHEKLDELHEEVQFGKPTVRDITEQAIDQLHQENIKQ
jgi:predicted transcriptional regulator